MRKIERFEVDEFYGRIRKLRERLEKAEEVIENLKTAIDKRAQYVEDVVEGLGRQLSPDTKECQQCHGAGGKWLTAKFDSSIPIFSSFSDRRWWACDNCKGTGRMRKESLLNVSADRPAKKKKG